MGLKDIPFFTWFFKPEKVKSSGDLTTLINNLSANINYKEYALQLCINKLASALSLCRFDTFENGQPKENHYWWRFNFEPNLNTNAPDFLYQIIYQMVYDPDGALVYQSDDGQLIVAESFTVSERSIYENVYTDIVLYGGYPLEGIYKESQVLRYQLPNKSVRKFVDGIYKDYGELIQVTTNAYIRERSMKLLLEIGTTFDQNFQGIVDEATGETEADQILDEILTQRFKGVFEPKDTLTPLEAGLSIKQLDESRSATVAGQIKANEVTELFIKTVDMVADAFAIPRGLLKGDVADVEAMTDNFITFAIRPLATEIESENNRKLYKFDNVSKKTKMKVITDSIKTYDWVKVANAADKYVAATVFNSNEIRRKLGEEESSNPELNKFRTTKNYKEAGKEE